MGPFLLGFRVCAADNSTPVRIMRTANVRLLSGEAHDPHERSKARIAHRINVHLAVRGTHRIHGWKRIENRRTLFIGSGPEPLQDQARLARSTLRPRRAHCAGTDPVRRGARRRAPDRRRARSRPQSRHPWHDPESIRPTSESARCGWSASMVMRQLGLVGATRGWANHIRARQATAPTANPVESAYPLAHAIGVGLSCGAEGLCSVRPKRVCRLNRGSSVRGDHGGHHRQRHTAPG